MPIPPSGPISMGMINVELTRPATQVISLNEAAVRALAQVPSGMISLSNFYGKSNITPAGYSLGARTPFPSYNPIASIYEFNLSNETGSILGVTTPTASSMNSMGNTDAKSIINNRVQTPVVPNLTIINLSRWQFSSKTFVSIGGTPAMRPNDTRSINQNSRMQSTDNWYGIAPYTPATPPNANNSRVGYTKYSLPTESFLTFNSLVPPGQVIPVPTTENLFTNSRSSFNAAKNYSRGWQFGGGAGTTSMFYPTDTGFVYWNGPILLDMGSYSPSPFTVNSNAVACIQSAENGFTFGGYRPAATGNVITTFMSRMAFGPQTATKDFQSVGVTRAGFSGWQTPTNGFFFGGTNAINPIVTPPTPVSEIWKYQFPNGSMGTISQSMGARNVNPYETQSAPVFG